MSWSRILSILVAATYFVLAAILGGARLAFMCGVFLIFPLTCIWFSEAMGGYTGLGMLAYDYPITKQSPGMVVCILGWVLLLLPALIPIICYFSP